jgi:two-component system, response regulator PdtaR
MLRAGSGVLVVDDEVLIADFAAMVVEDEGFDVVGVASSAREALAIAASRPPAIALLDVNLADGEDGVALAAELQSRHNTRVIFMSGSEDPEARARATSVAASGFLQKPFVAAELARVLKAAAANEPAV